MNPIRTLLPFFVGVALLQSTSGLANEPAAASADTAASNAKAASADTAASNAKAASADTASTAPAGSVPPGHPPVAQPEPQGAAPQQALLRGSPFDSPQHRLQAERVRAGQLRLPRDGSEPVAGVPAGMIAVLLRDAHNRPLAGKTITLEVVHEDIAEGNTSSQHTSVTDSEGRAVFSGHNTETSYRYELVYQDGPARHTTGEFRLRRDRGQIASLHVYPMTTELSEAFIFSRALYVISPREDIFQLQMLLRLHNGSPSTWVAENFRIPLPPGAKAFRPQEGGEIRTRHRDGNVELSGTVGPGQHEISFSFQLPNPGDANVELTLPRPPHLVDARVFLESSPSMGLSVPGLGAAEPTQGTDGQPALMASEDFLKAGRAPEVVRARITGLPTPDNGPYVALGLALLVALLGVAFAFSDRATKATAISPEDRERAKQLLLDELVRLERAYRAKEIGPKTYDQARRTLLDSLARLQLPAAA